MDEIYMHQRRETREATPAEVAMVKAVGVRLGLGVSLVAAPFI
jgi:hypothetical protein